MRIPSLGGKPSVYADATAAASGATPLTLAGRGAKPGTTELGGEVCGADIGAVGCEYGCCGGTGCISGR